MQHDAVSSMRKARSAYLSRQQEYEKIRDSAPRLDSSESSSLLRADLRFDKKKKQEDEALQRVNIDDLHISTYFIWRDSIADVMNGFY